MKLEAIHLKNFKAFKDVSVTDIPSFCVLVGANGSGKSTFFDLFGFLKDALTDNVRVALQKRGGFREVVSRGCEEESIKIEIKLRMPLLDKQRLVTYSAEISLDTDNRPAVARETLRYKRGEYGSPFHFIDFVNGNGFAVINEEDFDKQDEDLTREEHNLGSPDILALKGLGQFEKFKAANAVRKLIEDWHVSDLHVDSARSAKDAGYAEHLNVDGDNLALVTQFIFENHRQTFDTILETMARRVPGIEHVEAKETDDGRILLKFQDGNFKDPFMSRYVSDGTIRMFAFLVLLNDPSPHPLLCVEEPENQLYPKLLMELAEEFEEYAEKGGQVFVSTHSPDFLNAVDLSDIYWLQKRNGYTEIKRASSSELLRELIAAGDKPGWLWSQGLFEGVDP